MKTYFVYNNDTWHVIKNSKRPNQYERVIDAPAYAVSADDFDFYEEDNEGSKIWRYTLNDQRKNERLKDLENSFNKIRQKQKKIEEARFRLKSYKLDEINDHDFIKTVIKDILIVMNIK